MKRFSKPPILLIHCDKSRTIITYLFTANNTTSINITPSSTMPRILHFPLFSARTIPKLLGAVHKSKD